MRSSRLLVTVLSLLASGVLTPAAVALTAGGGASTTPTYTSTGSTTRTAATTITPAGAWSAITDGATAVITVDGGSLTCASDASGTVTEDGTGTLDSLTLTSCTGPFGISCTVTVSGLPRLIRIRRDYNWTFAAFTGTSTTTFLNPHLVGYNTATTNQGTLWTWGFSLVSGRINARADCFGTSLDCHLGKTDMDGALSGGEDPTRIEFSNPLDNNNTNSATSTPLANCTNPAWTVLYTVNVGGTQATAGATGNTYPSITG